MAETTERRREKRAIVATYNYHDASNAVIYQAVVYADGSRSVRVPDEKRAGAWQWGLSRWGVQPVPYRLPQLLAAAASPTKGALVVWVVPTEQDADALALHGMVATCAAADGKGAVESGWRKEWAPWFKGFQRAAVVCGRDEAGRGKQTVKRVLADWHWRLRAEAARAGLVAALGAGAVKAFALPPVGGKEPFGPAQWFDLGGSVDGLIAAARSAPPWTGPGDVMDIFVDAGFGMDQLGEIQEALRGSPAKGRPGGAASSPLPSPLPGPLPSPAGADVAGCAAGAACGVPPPLPLPERRSENVGGVAGDGDPRSIAALRGELLALFRDNSLDKFQRKTMMEQVAVTWLTRRGRFYYHKELKTHGTCMYFDTIDKRLSYIKRDYFGSWLALAMKVNPESGEFRYILGRIAAEALAGGATAGIVPERFWARRGMRVYLSCGCGRMVRCSAQGADVVDVGTDQVLFEEGGECEPWELLPGRGANPFRGSEACEVFRTMNAMYPRGRMLLELWATSLPGHGESTKPILLLSGRARSGKTRIALSIMELYGIPAKAQTITKEYKATDFWTVADFGGVMCLDNADSYIDWLPACLATVATCGSFSKKQNYKDNELITQRARCWCLVTGTQPSFASDSGVADRLLTVELVSRAAGDTKESALRDDIKGRRNAGLTWVCRAWCDALGDESMPPAAVNSRHPDWGVTAYRLARAINAEDEAVDAMTESEAGKAIFALRNDSLGECLIDAFGEVGFSGTAAEMSEALKAACDGFDGEKTWTLPKLGKALKRLEPHLVSAFKATRTDHSGRTNYVFSPIAVELRTPSMWGVNGHFEQTPHLGTISRDFTCSPPTSPTLQSFFGGEQMPSLVCAESESWADGWGEIETTPV